MTTPTDIPTPRTEAASVDLNEAMPFIVQKNGFKEVPRLFVASEEMAAIERENVVLRQALKRIAGEIKAIIAQACLAYHRRKLEECSGDAKELLEKLKNTMPIEPFGSSQRTCNLLDAQCIELFQLHTAKAVEERIAEPRKYNEVLHKEIVTLRKQYESMRSEISRLQEVPRLEHLETMKTNIDWLNSERVRLEKERDDLRTRLDEQRIRIMELDRAVDTMHQRAETAEKKLTSQEHSQAAISKAHIELDRLLPTPREKSHASLSDRITDLGLRAEKAEADTQAVRDVLTIQERRSIEHLQRAEVAEAEVAELKRERAQFDSLYELMPGIENQYSDRLYIHLHNKLTALTTLKQDVRPLVDLILAASKFSLSKPDYWASCSQCEHHKDDATEALETFLAAHPEMKP